LAVFVLFSSIGCYARRIFTGVAYVWVSAWLAVLLRFSMKARATAVLPQDLLLAKRRPAVVDSTIGASESRTVWNLPCDEK